MISVKEYAKSRGVTIQAVHQQMSRKRNSEKLEGHVQIIDGVKFLDEEAEVILDESRKKTPVVIIDDAKDERIAELEASLKRKEEYIALIEAAAMRKQEQVDKLEAKQLLIEEKRESEIAEAVQNAEEKLQNKHNTEMGTLRSDRDNWKKEAESYERTMFGFYRKKK